MKRAIVTPAALPPAALTQLKDWLGISIAADDAQLAALLRAALDACEDFTGVMPLEQVCEMLLPACAGWQDLTVRPVQAITGVEGMPAEGARFALPTGNYEIDLGADGSGRVRIIIPGAAGRIAVRFSAGIAAGWDALPDSLRHGILRLAASQFRQREGDSAGQQPPAAVAALWRPWRRLRLA